MNFGVTLVAVGNHLTGYQGVIRRDADNVIIFKCMHRHSLTLVARACARYNRVVLYSVPEFSGIDRLV